MEELQVLTYQVSGTQTESRMVLPQRNKVFIVVEHLRELLFVGPV